MEQKKAGATIILAHTSFEFFFIFEHESCLLPAKQKRNVSRETLYCLNICETMNKIQLNLTTKDIEIH